MDIFRKGRDKNENFFNSPLSKCRDERSEFYGIKEGQSLIFFPINNQQPAIGKVFISPSPLSAPRRVEEIFNYQLPLPIVVFGRPHRVAPTNNLISRSLAQFSLSL